MVVVPPVVPPIVIVPPVIACPKLSAPLSSFAFNERVSDLISVVPVSRLPILMDFPVVPPVPIEIAVDELVAVPISIDPLVIYAPMLSIPDTVGLRSIWYPFKRVKLDTVPPADPMVILLSPVPVPISNVVVELFAVPILIVPPVLKVAKLSDPVAGVGLSSILNALKRHKLDEVDPWIPIIILLSPVPVPILIAVDELLAVPILIVSLVIAVPILRTPLVVVVLIFIVVP
jgi:hypothetical protein